jgi:hypothetical protein
MRDTFFLRHFFIIAHSGPRDTRAKQEEVIARLPARALVSCSGVP